MHSFFKYYVILILALLSVGCSTTYVPISWGYGNKVKQLSQSDITLSTFFTKYDPDRKTLRVSGASFEEVMMPSEVKYHLGAYRPDTKLLYRNLYKKYDDQELRDVMVHEFAHHIWFSFMTSEQRFEWRKYLESNPSPLQVMVRSTYSNPEEHDAEDFAFTVEYPRQIDLEELAKLKVITPEERDALLKDLPSRQPPGLPMPATPAKVEVTKNEPQQQSHEQEEDDITQ